jgi:predicted metal-dependent HD superfamily phosphohydrolase
MLECSPHDQAWLQEKWFGLIGFSGAERSAGEVAWKFIESQHTRPWRFYHNLSHIRSMLRLADECKAHIADIRTVEFAVWFHDLFYETQARDNERRSARWACQALIGMGLDAALVSAVERCVLATQKHRADWFDIPDLPFFLDLDLAVLGAPEDEYCQYSEAIRREYGWVLDEAYCFGRKRVLSSFIQRPRIFSTTLMAERFEEQARQNLLKELADLG